MKARIKFKVSKIFALSFFVFWQFETWFFIIRDGWHWKAVTEAEKICDNIAQALALISAIFFMSILYDIVKIYSYSRIDEIIHDNET